MIFDIFKIIGLGAIWLGIAFNALGVIGLLRFPDVYSRLHATSKVATLGLLCLLIGLMFIMGQQAILRALALGIFMLVTAPVAGHVIAAGAYQAGAPLVGALRDDMKDAKTQTNQLSRSERDSLHSSTTVASD